MNKPPILSLRNITISFAKKILFENLNLNLFPNDRVCLIGKNGVGKSTLMNSIAGVFEFDSGERWVAPNSVLGYLTQSEKIRENVGIFGKFLDNEISDISLNLGNSPRLEDSSFTQSVLTLHNFSQDKKKKLLLHLRNSGIIAFHANFEPIPTLSLFKSNDWTKWINQRDLKSDLEMNEIQFKNAYDIYNYKGIGLARSNFHSRFTINRLIKSLRGFN